MKKYTFEENGKIKVFCQDDLTPKIQAEANKIRVKAFNEAVSNGFQLELQVDQMLESRGLREAKWETERAEQIEKDIAEKEKGLRKGVYQGQKLTKEQAWKLALEIRKLRSNLFKVHEKFLSYYNDTVESYAQGRVLQYYIYAVTRNEQGEAMWPNFDDYLNDNSMLVAEATKRFFESLRQPLDKPYEHKWLEKQGCLKDDQLYNLTGQKVDSDGNLIVEAVANDADQEDVWGVVEAPPVEVVTTSDNKLVE